jgi:hypothetical protein
LLHLAEAQGMAPLLLRHMTASGFDTPETFIRGLKLLGIRHRQSNAILAKSLKDILILLDAEGIPSMVLKGAALCQTLYPQIGLRPMRDIDLLLPKGDVRHAHDLLKRQGFATSTVPIPSDHFHLQPLYQTVDGLPVCVELHHGLYAPIPPYEKSPPFSALYHDAVTFDVDGVKAYSFKTEEMLSHLYQHGFHAPLTYEPYKLISAADIVGLVEKEVESIDWAKVQSVYPHLFNALQYFHYITPWTEPVLSKIPFTKRTIPSGVGVCFTGWPKVRFSEWKKKKLTEMLRLTFFPSKWWTLIYYTHVPGFFIFRCRLLRHWKQILWWAKLYGSHFYEASLKNTTGQLPGRKAPRFLLLKKIKTLIIAVLKFHFS